MLTPTNIYMATAVFAILALISGHYHGVYSIDGKTRYKERLSECFRNIFIQVSAMTFALATALLVYNTQVYRQEILRFEENEARLRLLIAERTSKIGQSTENFQSINDDEIFPSCISELKHLSECRKETTRKLLSNVRLIPKYLEDLNSISNASDFLSDIPRADLLMIRAKEIGRFRDFELSNQLNIFNKISLGLPLPSLSSNPVEHMLFAHDRLRSTIKIVDRLFVELTYYADNNAGMSDADYLLIATDFRAAISAANSNIYSYMTKYCVVAGALVADSRSLDATFARLVDERNRVIWQMIAHEEAIAKKFKTEKELDFFKSTLLTNDVTVKSIYSKIGRHFNYQNLSCDKFLQPVSGFAQKDGGEKLRFRSRNLRTWTFLQSIP